MKNGPFKGPFFLAENTPGAIGDDAVFIVRIKKSMRSRIWGGMFIFLRGQCLLISLDK